MRLGISAPEGLEVFREELYQQILAEEGSEPADAEAGAAASTPRERQPARSPGASDE
ncbi:hypothetical protein DB30_04473 [Enhygromyxa salina]|uniref:Carbon storage regulator n=1 Tax=Enhygromyxa salina TaxID=215803 RepID=A0A0C1ZFI8_9BACT|nr:hypothetical protein DB30_04473 [Enhygromyxa salina]